MKYSEFSLGDTVTVIMPEGCGLPRELEVTVIDKGIHGIVTFQKSDGKRFYRSASFIKEVVSVR